MIEFSTKTLKMAIAMAFIHHQNEVDAGGNPYLMHCMSVMLNLQNRGLGFNYQCAGVLHDVMEHGHVTKETLAEIFGEEFAHSIDCLSRRQGETWSDYLIRVKSDEVARVVKMADISDNRRTVRLNRELRESDQSLQDRYEKALDTLAK